MFSPHQKKQNDVVVLDEAQTQTCLANQSASNWINEQHNYWLVPSDAYPHNTRNWQVWLRSYNQKHYSGRMRAAPWTSDGHRSYIQIKLHETTSYQIPHKSKQNYHKITWWTNNKFNLLILCTQPENIQTEDARCSLDKRSTPTIHTYQTTWKNKLPKTPPCNRKQNHHKTTWPTNYKLHWLILCETQNQAQIYQHIQPTRRRKPSTWGPLNKLYHTFPWHQFNSNLND